MPKVEKYIEAPRVSIKDFVLGTNEEGEVKRFPGEYFITSLVNEGQYLALWQDERDARIAADDLFGIRIDNVELAQGTRLTDLENDLSGYKIEVQDELYGPGGIEASYQSAILQSSQQINLSVDDKLYGAGGIQESYRSEISIESDSIISTVNNTLYGPGGIEANYTSAITQLSNSIDLSIFQNGVLQAGLLIEKINNDPSRIALTADVIQIDGTTTFSSNYNPSEKTRTFRGAIVIPPYSDNDEWFADDGNHYICINSKGITQDYDVNDWILATRYVGSDEINDFVVQEIDPRIADLQKQQDNSLTYYFNESTSPVDTTGWGSKEEYNKWYQIDTKVAYEWLSDGLGGYDWQVITDNAIIDLLERASLAQDTADLKRRVFVDEPPETPDVPYDVGDLWVQGIDGDILTCMTPKTSTQFYAVGDFAKKNKYTDDTEALKKSTKYIYGTDPSLEWADQSYHVADEWVVHAEFNENTASWNFWTGYPTPPTSTDGNYIKTNFIWDGTEWDIDDTQIDGGRIVTNSIFAESINVDEVLAGQIYASGATIGGFTINETSLQLGNQSDWAPAAGGSGVLMGQDTDNLYKLFIGKQDAYFLWDGTQLSLTGDVLTDAAFADNIYLSGATIGGFNITENYLNLGSQITWNPNSATEGLIMGLDTVDGLYKFFVGNNTDHLIWNGSNLIISGFALIGDASSTTTLNDLAEFNDYFEIVNPGQANEYIKAKAPFASTGDIQAWTDGGDFPPSIWDSMRIASSTYVGGVKLSSDFNIAADGTITVNGDIGGGFDESLNYSPTGIWNFVGTLNYGGNAVATESWATGQFEPKFTKNTAFNKAFGGTGSATTVARSDHNHAATYHPLGGSSTRNFTVNDLVIHGTVNHWVGDVITVDDARLQLNRTQDAATVASGIDIWNGTSVVSSLLYNTAGRWQIGGQNIATETWVTNTAKAADSNLLDNLNSSQFLRSDENDWTSGWLGINKTTSPTEALDVNGNIKASLDIYGRYLRGNRLGVTGVGTDTKAGLSLYNGDGFADQYGIQFMTTASTGYGTHGSVTGTHAMYFNMSSTADRGWIFRTNGSLGNAASISTEGNLTLDGYIKGNGTGKALRVQSNYGYLQIGPESDSWAHFRTDRSDFWFEKRINVNGGAFSSYNSNLYLQTDKTTRATIDTSGNILTTGNIRRSTHNSGHLEGGHNNIGSTAAQTNPIYTIGSSYNPYTSTLNNMYGIGYSHSGNASFLSGFGSGWGLYVAADGNARIFLDGSNGHIVATGNVTASGEVTAYSTSDFRLKQNINTFDNALSLINQFRPVTFNWNEAAKQLNSAKDDRQNYGLIAQELEAICPSLVHTIYGGKYKAIDYPQIININSRGIQEVDSKVQVLERRVHELEQIIHELKN